MIGFLAALIHLLDGILALRDFRRVRIVQRWFQNTVRLQENQNLSECLKTTRTCRKFFKVKKFNIISVISKNNQNTFYFQNTSVQLVYSPNYQWVHFSIASPVTYLVNILHSVLKTTRTHWTIRIQQCNRRISIISNTSTYHDGQSSDLSC